MDQEVFKILHQLAGKSGFLDGLLVFLAEYLPYLLIIIFLALIFRSFRENGINWVKRFYFIFLTILSLLIGRGIIVSAIRFFWPRPRPFVALNFEPLINMAAAPSFPSGHAALFFTLAAVAYLINRRWGIYLFIGAIINALARVAVGVHWPLDIVGGAVLGIIVVLFLRRLLPSPSK